MCDGEDGPAIARVKIHEYDGSYIVVYVCKQCRKDHAEDTVKVYKRLLA